MSSSVLGGATTVAAVCAAVFAYLALQASWDAVDEARKATGEAHTQAQAAVGQLNEMQATGKQTEKLIDANTALARAAQKSADTADKSMIASQRAWVGSVDAAITSPTIGKVVRGTVTYINSGREPARLQAGAGDHLHSRSAWESGQATTEIIRRKEACFWELKIIGDRYAWPTISNNAYNIHFPEGSVPETQSAQWTEALATGEEILTVEGCIIYEAFGEIHHTSFCYFYDQKLTPDMAHLNICRAGNSVN